MKQCDTEIFLAVSIKIMVFWKEMPYCLIGKLKDILNDITTLPQ